jgi:hypothetical protein
LGFSPGVKKVHDQDYPAGAFRNERICSVARVIESFWLVEDGPATKGGLEH